MRTLISRWKRLSRSAEPIALALALALGACGDDEPSSSGEPAPRSEDQVPSGTVRGIVRLADGAELPSFPLLPIRSELPLTCSEPRLEDRTPIRMAASGRGLEGMPIVIRPLGEDRTRWPSRGEPRIHDAAIRDCRLSPRVIVATRGDRIRLRNETDYPFFPNLGAAGFHQALMRGEPITSELDQPGPRTIECQLTAPCGRIDVLTFGHPLHAITGAGGRFEIEGVPADQPLRVSAWHPLFQEATVETRLTEGQASEVEIVITPAPQTAPTISAVPADSTGTPIGPPVQLTEPAPTEAPPSEPSQDGPPGPIPPTAD